MAAGNFILGYTLPLLPMAVAQMAVCFLVALAFGLPLNANLLLAIVVLLPAAVLYIGIGLLCGTVFNDKQVGGICGALLTNLRACRTRGNAGELWGDFPGFMVGDWICRRHNADCSLYIH